jgi:PAS domain S-box-containing protein
VEDNADHRFLMEQVLAQTGSFSFFEGVETVGQAVEKLTGGAFDLILLDYRVRDGTGLELIDCMKGQGIELPIIMVTGLGDESVAVRALKSGAADYVVKDRDYYDRLPSVVARVMENHELHESLKQAEVELALSRDRYRSLYENASQGFVVFNRETQSFSQPNRRFLEIFSLTCDEIEGKSISQIPIFQELLESSALGQAYRSCQAGQRGHDLSDQSFDVRFSAPDGGYRWAEIAINDIPGFSGFIISVSDVTRQKTLEEDLRSVNERLKNHAHDLEMQVGDLKRRLEIEPTLEEAFYDSGGAPASFVIAKGCSYLVREEKSDTSFRIFKDLVASGLYGLCILRTDPRTVRQRYGLQKTPLIWLCKQESGGESLSPSNLGAIADTVRGFTEKADDSAVLIEGFEYLVLVNGFSKVMLFLNDIVEIVIRRASRLIVPVSPATLEPKELAILERALETIRGERRRRKMRRSR